MAANNLFCKNVKQLTTDLQFFLQNEDKCFFCNKKSTSNCKACAVGLPHKEHIEEPSVCKHSSDLIIQSTKYKIYVYKKINDKVYQFGFCNTNYSKNFICFSPYTLDMCTIFNDRVTTDHDFYFRTRDIVNPDLKSFVIENVDKKVKKQNILKEAISKIQKIDNVYNYL